MLTTDSLAFLPNTMASREVNMLATCIVVQLGKQWIYTEALVAIFLLQCRHFIDSSQQEPTFEGRIERRKKVNEDKESLVTES